MRALSLPAIVLSATVFVAGCRAAAPVRAEPVPAHPAPPHGAASAIPSDHPPARAVTPSAEFPDFPYPPEDPRPGDVIHVPTGLKLTFEQMSDLLAPARVIYFGETHDNVRAHEAQLRLLRELERRRPGAVALGMEMFRVPQQPALDRWIDGGSTEAQFLKESEWFDNWGSDWNYYRDLLLFARERRMPVLALNPPEELQKAVSKTPFDELPPELRAQLPAIGPADPYQTAVLRGISAGHAAVPGMFEAFERVQRLWEESMAQRIADYLASERGRGRVLLVLAGGWHVRHGFGVPKKVLRRVALPYAIVLSEEVGLSPQVRAKKGMEVTLPEVPLPPGDFAWMLAYEDLEGRRARLGVRFEEKDGAVVLVEVLPDGPGAKAGLLAGDVVLSVDGEPVKDAGDLRALVATKRPGGEAAVGVRRAGAEKSVVVRFPPGTDAEGAPAAP